MNDDYMDRLRGSFVGVMYLLIDSKYIHWLCELIWFVCLYVPIYYLCVLTIFFLFVWFHFVHTQIWCGQQCECGMHLIHFGVMLQLSFPLQFHIWFRIFVIATFDLATVSFFLSLLIFLICILQSWSSFSSFR